MNSKIALPWTELDVYQTYRRYNLRRFPLIEVCKRQGYWSIYTFVYELPIMNLPYGNQFKTSDEAKKVLDNALIELGYELISNERAEKLSLLL